VLILLIADCCASYQDVNCATTTLNSVSTMYRYTLCDSSSTIITVSAAAAVSFAQCTFAGVVHPTAISSYDLQINGGLFSATLQPAISFQSNVTNVSLSLYGNVVVRVSNWNTNGFEFKGLASGLALDIDRVQITTTGSSVWYFQSGVQNSSILISSAIIEAGYFGLHNIAHSSAFTVSVGGLNGALHCNYYCLYLNANVSGSDFRFVGISGRSDTVDFFRVQAGTWLQSNLTFDGGTYVAPSSNYKSVFRQNGGATSGDSYIVIRGAAALSAVYVMSVATCANLRISIYGNSFLNSTATDYAVVVGDSGSMNGFLQVFVSDTLIRGRSSFVFRGNWSQGVRIAAANVSVALAVVVFSGSSATTAGLELAVESSTMVASASIVELLAVTRTMSLSATLCHLISPMPVHVYAGGVNGTSNDVTFESSVISGSIGLLHIEGPMTNVVVTLRISYIYMS
jgi:hypothetical protein